MTLEDLEWVAVKTTIPATPYLPIDSRPDIKTERLLIRPVHESDAQDMHILRTQPEVMIWTTQGKPDADMEATRAIMANRLTPNDATNYDFAICLAETGEFLGIGGSFRRDGELGWPEVGYMLRKEHWGKGYGTEFLNGFLKAWWKLPREEVEIKVDKNTIEGGGELKDECLVAVTTEDNKASQNVMKKCGMTLKTMWTEEDLRGGGNMVTVYGFTVKRPVA